jgi:hypothetical protein
MTVDIPERTPRKVSVTNRSELVSLSYQLSPANSSVYRIVTSLGKPSDVLYRHVSVTSVTSATDGYFASHSRASSSLVKTPTISPFP